MNFDNRSVFLEVLSGINWFSIIFSGVIVFLLAFFIASMSTEREYDSTDNGKERSGLSLYTDHMTGCQYLEAGRMGGITPRLNGYGEHVGCHKGKR